MRDVLANQSYQFALQVGSFIYEKLIFICKTSIFTQESLLMFV